MEEYKLPAEHQPLPQEHSLPEEYPVSKSVAETKKKSSARRIVAMCLTGFVAIQLLFSYFVPPTDDKKEPSEPDWTQPGIIPETPVKPGYDIGDFRVETLHSDYDDSALSEYISEAAGYYEIFDYVRASVGLYNSLLFYNTDVPMGAIDHVGYTVDNGSTSSFNPALYDAVHIYYECEEVWYENKIGEMESYNALRGSMVLLEEEGAGTRYRVLTIRVSDEESYGWYGTYFSYSAEYIEGVFTVDGTSQLCTKTAFYVTDDSQFINLDGKYAVSGDYRLSGSVSNGAFMNGVCLETDIVFEAGVIFVQNPDRPGRNVTFDVLTEDGCLDLTHESVLDETTSYNENAWDTFKNDPAIRYLAYTTYIRYKYNGSEEGAELYELDITKPLFPLSMHTAFCIRQIVSETRPDAGGDTQPDMGDVELPNVDMSLYSPGLINASNLLMGDDYIGASIALTDTFRANYSSALNDSKLIYADGSIQPFAGQDLTDGSGTYISLMEQIVMVYNEKVDDYDPEMHLFATLIHASDLDTGVTDTKIVSVEIPYYYLGGNVDYTYAEVEYFDALVDEYFHGDMLLLSYSLNGSNDASGSTSRDGYYVTANFQVENGLTGGVAGLETRYKDCGLQLTDDKTALIPKGALQEYANIVVLDSAGMLVEPTKIAEVDLTALDSSTDEFYDTRDKWIADPNVRYILYADTGGGLVLYVKNEIYKAGESHRGLRIYEKDWDAPLFQPSDTLPVWISLYKQIRK